jgi:hypothetical protein
MAVADFITGPDQAVPKHRSSPQWSRFADAVSQREGYPLALTGVLLHARNQREEECNCMSPDQRLHDVHINLVASDGQDASACAIVEVTPRIRSLHPKWVEANLNKLKGKAVRVTGWVTFDNEHQDMITKGTRKTLWEVHPILHFEVKDGSGWKDVDDVL